MTVKIFFFGAASDAAGKREIKLSFAPETKTSEVFAHIAERFPRLKDHKLLYAINQQYVESDKIVKDGDELAIFTAVSGG